MGILLIFLGVDERVIIYNKPVKYGFIIIYIIVYYKYSLYILKKKNKYKFILSCIYLLVTTKKAT